MKKTEADLDELGWWRLEWQEYNKEGHSALQSDQSKRMKLPEQT